MKGVLHIPNLDRRLLSVPKISQHGLDMRFDANQCDMFRGNDLVVSAKREGNVYTLNVRHERAMVVDHNNAESKWELWHARIGHPSHTIYDKTQQSSLKVYQEFRTKMEICAVEVLRER